MAWVLLAEDDEDVAALMQTVLSGIGHEVVRARNGDEALRLATAGRFDALVFDVSMPHLTGLEVIERLEASPRVGWTPVVLVTAEAVEDLPPLRTGITYMRKPFELDQLVAAVQQAVDGSPES